MAIGGLLIWGFFGLLFVVGAVFLQFYLARRESRFLGLILPAITLLWSVLLVLNIVQTGLFWETLVMMGMIFVIANIPTIVLLIIYFVCRERVRKKKQLDKMNIQDLD